MSAITAFRADNYDGGEGGFGGYTASSSSLVNSPEEKKSHSSLIANCVISGATGAYSAYGILRFIGNETGNPALLDTSTLVESVFMKIIPALLMGVGVAGFMLMFTGCGDRKLTETESKVGAIGLGMMVVGYTLSPGIFTAAVVVKSMFSSP